MSVKAKTFLIELNRRHFLSVEKHNIRYTTIECKSLLNKSGISDYAVNCYSGCEHGCIYCYARFATRFTHPRENWGSFVDIKTNAVQVLTREVKRKPVGNVILSSVCDGWQPMEKESLLTRQCLELLLRYRYQISILTKSALVGRDLDLMEGGNVDLGVTITTLDEKLASLIEPGASPPQARLTALQKAKSKGISISAFVGPLMPFLSDTEQNIINILKMLKEVGVEHFYVDKLNLRYGVWSALIKFLHEYYPDLIEKYSKIYFTDAGKMAYQENLSATVKTVAHRLGMDDRMNPIF
jgi:DNA repair photolyase